MTFTNNEPVSWWSWRGRTSRRAYAWWGVGLFFFKYNLDRLLAYKMAGVSWLPWSYFAPPSVIAPSAPAVGQRLALVLAITSLPFIVVGVLLTFRRLRDAAWPLWFTPLFFVPFGNVVFFLALCLLPTATTSDDAADRREPSTLRRMFTFSSRVGSAAAAVALTVILAVPVTALSTIVARNYGWGLFVGVPFFLRIPFGPPPFDRPAANAPGVLGCRLSGRADHRRKLAAPGVRRIDLHRHGRADRGALGPARRHLRFCGAA